MGALRRAFLTGATGFVGANLARTLLGDGIPVRALAREGSDRSSLEGLDVEILSGDLFDRARLRRQIEGCDACFHLAAAISHSDPREVLRVNVDGSRAVLEAAAEAGCTAVIHASTIGTLRGKADGAPARETDSGLPPDASVYARSKLLSEEAALEAAAGGAPVVIAHLAAPVGPWDRVPTVTGRRILAVLEGKPLNYPAPALNHVHVRDVARGLILAAERGQRGARYLLAKEGGNLSREAFVEHVARAAGIPPPRHAGGKGILGRLLGFRRRSRTPAYLAVDPSWSVKELGLPQTGLDIAFGDAVAWFLGRKGRTGPD